MRLIRVTRTTGTDGQPVYTLSEYTGLRRGREWYAANGIVQDSSALPLTKLKFDGTNIVPKTEEELASEETAQEKAYFDDLYAQNTDGMLAVRVREYKTLIDKYGLTYDAKIPDIQMRIINDETLSTEEKLISGEMLKGTFDGVIVNLESLGFATAHWDAWRLMEKLIEYLPPEDPATV